MDPCPNFDPWGRCELGRDAPTECRNHCPANDERNRMANESDAQEAARRVLWQQMLDGAGDVD